MPLNMRPFAFEDDFDGASPLFRNSSTHDHTVDRQGNASILGMEAGNVLEEYSNYNI